MAHPTIADAERVDKYTVVASQDTFAVTFPVFSRDGSTGNADLDVYVDGVLQSPSTWSFSGTFTDGVANGGSVVLDTAITSGTVYIVGNITAQRDSDYAAGGIKTAFVNTDFDRIWAAFREGSLRDMRAVKIPAYEDDSDATPVDQVLPDLATRASKALGFDANGRPAVSSRTLAAIDAGDLPFNAVVTTLSGLKGLTPEAGMLVYMQGHQTAFDGGGGVFRWDDTSAAADDNGLTILPTGHSGNGRWRRINFDFVTPQMFGANGLGAGDASTAIQACVDTDLHVFLDGQYTIQSGIVFPSGWRGSVTGHGPGESVIVGQGAITMFDLTDTSQKSGCVFRGFKLSGDQTAGQVGIDVFYFAQNSVFEDISIFNCDIGMRVEKSFHASYSNINIKDSVTYGLEINAGTSADTVNGIAFHALYIEGGVNCVNAFCLAHSRAVSFVGSTFEQSKETAVRGENIDFTFYDCYFEGNFSDARTTGAGTVTLGANDGVDVRMGHTLGGLQQLAFYGSYHNTQGSWVASSNKNIVRFGNNVKLTAHGNFNRSNGGASVMDFWFRPGIGPFPDLDGNGGDNPAATLIAPTLPTLANSSSPTLGGDWTSPVWYTGGADTYTALFGGYRGKIVTIIADHGVTWTHGTNFFLRDGKNWTMPVGARITFIFAADNTWKELSRDGDCLSASKTYDPPNLTAGTQTTTTVTVTGAALGDPVENVSFDNDLQGITVTAYVSAANTVTVVFNNATAGALDLASGTLFVRVRKV